MTTTTATRESHTDFYLRWNALARPYFQWQVDQFEGRIGRRVGDLGCGPANITGCLADRDLYLAVDLDPAMPKIVAERFPQPNVKTWTGDFTTPAFKTHARELALDTIMSFNTIEHIEDDRTAVAAMIDVLPRGGYLNVLVPAHQALFGTLDKLDGHYRRYTTKSLKALFHGHSVEIEKLHYFNCIAAPGWWLKGRVLKETAHADENYKLMGYVIPLMRKLEGWVKPPFGLSVICSARKI